LVGNVKNEDRQLVYLFFNCFDLVLLWVNEIFATLLESISLYERKQITNLKEGTCDPTKLTFFSYYVTL
jgi:hypothetical protein